MRLINAKIYTLMFLNFLLGCNPAKKSINEFGVCYGKVNANDVMKFKHIVLESLHYSNAEMINLKSTRTELIAYMSVGEINKYHPSFPLISDHLKSDETHWESYHLDLNNNEVKEVLFGVVHSIAQKGFHGIFLDNVDHYGIYGPLKDDKTAFVELLREIKHQYPNLKIWQNAGLDLIAETRDYIDVVLVESIYTDYDFVEKQYLLRDANVRDRKINYIKELKKKWNIPVYIVEYSDNDEVGNKITKYHESNKISSFISTIDLQKIH